MASRTSQPQDRWRRVDEVFARVAELPPDDQPGALARLCGTDRALRDEVSALLAADRAADKFLERTGIGGEGARPSRPETGRIGDYRLLRLVSEGGMGAIYLAARADDLYQRRVAIKLIRSAADSEEVRYRFQVERQILATLEHPYIARLYDAGVTPEGAPYLVLEWVQGQPIDAWCDDNRLPVRPRLELFLKVCEAVEFAHRNLLVHRDLKPDNILVNAAGEPKLLDFGIAKPLAPEAFEQTVRQTATGMALMTPRYASPEQVLGQPVTTATDVYALGVVLNELLTGALPYRLTQRSAHELAQQILTAEPLSPSQTIAALGAGTTTGSVSAETVCQQRRASAAELRRRLRGDLDTIVLTALRKEPDRRYPSVARLAQDIRDHLADQPISARPDTWRYRTAKLIRRHPLALSAGALAIAAAGFFAVTLALQSARIAAEAEKSSQALAVLVEVFRASDTVASGGREVSAREVLDAAAARIAGDPQRAPELIATLYDALGQVYLNLGLLPEAERLLEQADQAWMAGDARGAGPGRTSANRARLRLAQDDAAGARGLAERAVAALDAADAPVSELAGALNLLGTALARLGELERAEAAHHRAREALEGLPGDRTDALSETYLALGSIALARSQFGVANSLYRQALALLLERYGERHPRYAATLARHAEVLQAQGAAAEAESVLRQALEIQRAALAPDHPDVHASMLRLGNALEAGGRAAEAEDLYRQALVLARAGARPVATAASLRALGGLLARTDRLAEAQRTLSAAVGLLEDRFGAADVRIAGALSELAEVQITRGEVAAAGTTLARVLEIAGAQTVADRALLAQTHQRLGQVMTMDGRYREAQEHFAAAARLTSD